MKVEEFAYLPNKFHPLLAIKKKKLKEPLKDAGQDHISMATSKIVRHDSLTNKK